MDIVTTGVAFLIGVATGAGGTYFADKYTDKRRNKEKNKQDASLFENIWNQHLPLLKEMKEDLENPDLIHHRNFYLLDSSWMFNFDAPYLVYYIDKHSSLENQVAILESHGFVTENSEPGKNVRRFRFTEQFVEKLRAKKYNKRINSLAGSLESSPYKVDT
ncbi:hypothetical protein R1T43_09290 [Alteromonas sp. CI.11.F.A3]|uniref:hypothetical protein n=1 Tax=Alteromonas sp. CI.11.F.A3 TaxID=3079555 RepID=UPI0029436E31|nr:hypothetical protein [Alteromonas sp. CI.11.F.A3]WOI39198.1 hypothetical protein R1T43_09290 [Alteromonas sp. CI.11.F.A3]